MPVKLAWLEATDAGTGASHYELQRSVNGGAFSGVALPSATTTSITPLLEAAKSYQYRVRAQDNAGNWSAWAEGPSFAADLYQEDYQAVSYTGGWTLQALSTASGGYVKHTSARGAKAQFSFAGRNVAWVAAKGPDRGKAQVWIDGKKVATVNLYSSQAQPRQIVFTRSWETSDSHTLTIKVLGRKKAASSGKRLDMDAFVTLR